MYMKCKLKFLIAIMSTITCVVSSAAQMFTVSFSETDYEIFNKDDGKCIIKSKIRTDDYNDRIAPCIPMTTKRFVLPYESSVSDFVVVENGCHLVGENVILDNNPISVPTSQLNTPIEQENTIEYAKQIYPSRNVELQTVMEWQGLPMACFEITPFRYDAETKNLYFIDSFTIDINLGISNSRKSKRLDRVEEVVDIAKGMVENPEDVENVIAQSSETAREYLDTIEYLLITTTELEPAFRKLVNWKKSKGIYAIMDI